ncbi:MAG TPA: hypothetical protein VD927_04390 [Chryseosolibacter sp.]|nr:hypothetical protein [Chryseosolibacter sp.]
MEPRAKTIIERHGFVDLDRRRAKHDEVQIWVYKNFARVVREVFPLLQFDDSKLDIKLEFPVTDHGYYRNFIVGFADLYCQQLSIGIEVKTELPVIGDLIRQIQFYRKYLPGTWIIVSPDDRHAGILREQDIWFYKYEDTDVQLSLFELRVSKN